MRSPDGTSTTDREAGAARPTTVALGRQLLGLAREQRQAARSGDFEAVAHLFRRREELIGRLDAAGAGDDGRAGAEAAELRGILSQVLEADATSMECIRSGLSRLARDRENVTHAREGLHSYRQSHVTAGGSPRVVDGRH